MIFNRRVSGDHRAGYYGLTVLSFRVEWAYDLDTIVFGAQTGLDTGSGFWYAKFHFGPFQFAVIALWGSTSEDRPNNKAKDEVSGPPTDKPA